MNHLPIARIALAPLLIWQGRGVRRRALRLPEAAGPREGMVTDPATPPMRLLIVGDSSAAGVGVDTQQQALTGRLAAELQRRAVPALSWRLTASTGWTTADCLAALSAAPPDAADRVVVALGVNDVTADLPPARWLARIDRLDRLLREHTAAPRILYSGLPPMHRFPLLPQPLRWYLGERARQFNDLLLSWTQQAGHRAFVSLPDVDRLSAQLDADQRAGLIAVDGFHPGPHAYRIWAAALADSILTQV